MPIEIYRERLGALHAGSPDELVLLHGWGSSSAVWRGALRQLREAFTVTLVDLPGHGRSAPGTTADEFIEALMPQLPARATYLGWSLGGMLAARIAARFPERVSALICVASNACFTAQENWPTAMAPQTFDNFYREVARSPDRALKRFQALQFAGDEREKALLSHWRKQQGDARLREPLRGLDWLRTLDNRAALDQVQCPALHVFGERDALVPNAAAKDFVARWPDHKVTVIEGAAHVPFLSAPAPFWDSVLGFLPHECTQPASLIDKRAVARSFGRAAQTYDSVADLQRSVADALFEQLPPMHADTVLDLGCGTGYSLPALRERFPQSQLLAADLAEGMLSYARHRPERQADAWLCADAEDLPLADDSLDLIFSSLSVQWCENCGALFAEIYRTLKPGGLCALSTLGPDTLVELREAWREVDEYTHVNRFPERAHLEQAITASGLRTDQWREQRRVLSYRKLGELTAELKELGAHNLNSGRPGGLTGRRRLRAFTEAYERFRRDDGQLPASYQVWIVMLGKPHA